MIENDLQFMNSQERRFGIPMLCVTGILGSILGAVACWLSLSDHNYASKSIQPNAIAGPSAAAPPATMLSTTSARFVPPKTLESGDRLPQIIASGWLNGEPIPIGESQRQIWVIDVWAQWCPFCRQTAPNLFELAQKFDGLPVSFLSLTNEPKDSVQRMIDATKISWPNAFGVSLETIRNLGAITNNPMPGYEVKPTIYIIGANGRVVWSDQHMRYRHKSPEETTAALEAAITTALDALKMRS